MKQDTVFDGGIRTHGPRDIPMEHRGFSLTTSVHLLRIAVRTFTLQLKSVNSEVNTQVYTQVYRIHFVAYCV